MISDVLGRMPLRSPASWLFKASHTFRLAWIEIQPLHEMRDNSQRLIMNLDGEVEF